MIEGVNMYQFKVRKNKNNIFVRECITQAFFELLKNKSFEEITVTDIIKKSGVSRMGFYRNFTTKESVVEDYILDVFVETVEEIKKTRKLDFSTDRVMTTTLENFKKYAEIIKLFLSKNMEFLLYDCYQKAYSILRNGEKTKISHIREYSERMFIGELFSLEMCWIKSGMKESPTELARIYKLIHFYRK